MERFKDFGPYRFSNARFSAKRKKAKWRLNREQYYKLIKNKCIYCFKNLDAYGIGLDRKNPKGDYRVGNVVPCCKRCNWIKGSWFSYSQMIRVGKLIKEFK